MNAKQLAVKLALAHLRAAREALKEAEAPRATDYVRRAMKSAEGALRHAGRGDLFPGVVVRDCSDEEGDAWNWQDINGAQ
jgi:hypothetical protein